MRSARDEPGTPREALERAEYVVTADIGPRMGTAAGGAVYSVSTLGLPVLKGDEVGHTELGVVVAPVPCPAGAGCGCAEGRPGADPLAGLRRAVLFLRWDDTTGYWHTLTPGVLPPLGPQGSLPGHWPSG
ncbi:hypothetical protein [Streptomyces albipurpureus]|uniref:Uncharacterized protein n=1 Tax=Streptomyces albipurpureus TaxID=2897419 RepID=A0ABT0UJN9_9ACTN|nr:hypothetical protein [Streptomyces sp. CWNU-1]MCM2387805.1 hypothetical protein [Streptomyces sp. CWNU-1]